MVVEKLQIFQSLKFDEDIVKEQLYPYYPRTKNFNLCDEVRISIHHQDVYTLPSESYIYIEGKFNKIAATGATGSCKLTNNAYAFLFDQIRYEINSVEIDKCIKPGLTTTMKSYTSYNDQESKMMEMAGWCPFKNDQPTISGDRFSAYIPLKFLLGFAEDYKQILVNVSQELILIRSSTDDNCYINETASGTQKAKIELEKIEWHIPHVQVSDKIRLSLLKSLHGKKTINIPYRKWDLIELPALRNVKQDIWSMKTSVNMEKPRYVIVGFQNKRKDNHLADSSTFDHSSIRNIKLYLNSDCYPYSAMNLDMKNKRYVVAYRMYANFQNSYYDRPNQPLMDYNQFMDCTLYVIDCSYNNNEMASSAIDVKLEMECEQMFNDDTAVYALILHDSVVEYTPFDGTVRKVI